MGVIREEKWDDDWGAVARMWGASALVMLGMLGAGGLALNFIKNQPSQSDPCPPGFEPTVFSSKIGQVEVANVCIDNPQKTRIFLGDNYFLRSRGTIGETGLTRAEIYKGAELIGTGVCSQNRCSLTLGKPKTY